MRKLTVAVLFGGCSSEYQVSLQSAHAVISHLDTGKYNPVLIGINPEGQWFRFSGSLEKIKAGTWCNVEDCTKAIISPSRDRHGLVELVGDEMRVTRIDAAMPVLHGRNGEDGTVQGLLELAGIPIVGCKTLCSALCMDKDRAHKIVAQAGIRVPRSILFDKKADFDSVLSKTEGLGYPLFIKPLRAGSSLGISKVLLPSGLSEALERAFKEDTQIIAEENIAGFEVGCAVMGNEKLSVGEIDEIELADGFFDYREKYTLETSSIHVPARIPQKKAQEVKETACLIYKALDCDGFARVDMFLTPSGEIVFNEVNTIPGFTEHSRFPNMFKAAGMDFSSLMDALINLAVGV